MALRDALECSAPNLFELIAKWFARHGDGSIAYQADAGIRQPRASQIPARHVIRATSRRSMPPYG
jgi:hypothetical protein